MCANPEMMRTLAAELREEMAARKRVRRAGGVGARWPIAACAAAAVCLAAIAVH